MQQIYKINMSRISDIKKRALIRTLKIFGITIVIMITARYFSVNHDVLIGDLWLLPFIIAILSFLVYRAIGKLAKIYETLEIRLTDVGVERKAETWGYKIVKWPDIQIKQNRNGTIEVYDKNISAFNRKMYGTGWIQIEPEIENVDLLMTQIHQRTLL